MHPETWFLEEIYDDLRIWSQWWIDHRMTNGLLCWGSDPYEPTVGNDWESVGVNDRYGAALESGLDNSPMYDDIPFDRRTHQLMLQDAGLNGLYIADCDALAEIADILGKTGDAEALAERASQFRVKIQELWDDDFSLFLNRRTDTGEFSKRISPTNFYPMLGKAATEQQARRMIENHFYNPDEFWGDWIMPSIARNDPAYPDQDYWRGRIWAPMNFLVYLGIKRYDLPKAASDLSKKSNQLILREWEKHRHVHENYCGDTGMGCNKENSDRFYHWGGLLAAIALMENGYFDNSV
jgi:neutral trehalase